MTFVSRLVLVHGLTAVLVMVGLTSRVNAQTPPRPAVDVRQIPSMWRHATPTDFNGDGRLDLIAGEAGANASSFGPVVVRLGNGDGTFRPAMPTGVSGIPATTADFNADGRRDVVIAGAGGAMWILPGRGDGTFDAPRSLDTVEDFRFARTDDLNADGIPDLVVGYGTTVEVQPGLGDFTFGPSMMLPPGNESGPSAAVIADFNADGRRDIAVAQLQGSVFLYLNRGGLLFDVAEIVVADDNIYDITAADLNGDSDPDLIVPHTSQFEASWEGFGIEVLLGRAGGTFAPAARYEGELRGPTTVAAGDFNRDGIVDVAIGNRAFGWDDIGDYLTYCDGFSIFPGRGDGTLAPAASFRLVNFPVVPSRGFDAPYVNTHHALTAADVNGDGRADLVASPGAIILNRAATANRPPSAYAGPDRTVDHRHFTELSVTAADPDWDWLRVAWRSENGDRQANQPAYEFFATQDSTMIVTVTDGRGGTATDSVFVDGDPDPHFVDVIEPRPGVYPSGGGMGITWEAFNGFPLHHFRVSVSLDNFTTSRILNGEVPAGEREFLWENFGPPGTTWRAKVDALDVNGTLLATDTSDIFTIGPHPPDGLPWPWEAAGINEGVVTGDALYANGVFTVRGGGADVWGTSDGFHIAFQRIDGDVTFTARVASVEGSHVWTKVGIMIRESLNDNAAHHFLLASVGRGLAYQRRPTTGGTSLHTSLGTGRAPVVFRIIRQDGRLTLQMAASGTSSFTTVATATFPTGTVYIGLVTSSHDPTRLATGRFDGVQVLEPSSLPADWENNDVGTVGAGGGAVEAGGRWTVRGSGADVWGTADEFHYAHTWVTGDFDFSARVASVEHVNRWTKAGLMLREAITPTAEHAFVIATPGIERGVMFQGRVTQGGTSASFGSPALIPPPVYLRLTRQGQVVHAYYRRAATDPWTMLAGVSYPNLAPRVAIGFAVSSHVDGRVATATFEGMSIRPLPDWQSRDIGALSIAGRTIEDGPLVTMEASGADIWGTTDAFRFRYAQGDEGHTVTARVVSIGRAHDWTKAGVMICETLQPGSKHVMLIVSPGKGLAMQYRAETDGISANAGLMPGTAPEWLRLSRVGHTFHGDISNDGLTWTRIGSISVNMVSTVHTGLALTSHNTSALATATFDNVSVVAP